MRKSIVKLISLLIMLMVATLSFTACSDSTEIRNKTPFDARHTPAHEEIVTDYEYKYNWWSGEFVLVPNIHTRIVPDKYEVLYRIEYTDGKSADKWETVGKEEYDRVVAFLEE